MRHCCDPVGRFCGCCFRVLPPRSALQPQLLEKLDALPDFRVEFRWARKCSPLESSQEPGTLPSSSVVWCRDDKSWD